MAKLVEHDGVTYCQEDDGTEWEYTPPEPAAPAQPSPEERIAALEEENAKAQEENVQLKDRLATSESATAENSMTIQLLLEELILKEVI